jgi:hypothetical protein
MSQRVAALFQYLLHCYGDIVTATCLSLRSYLVSGGDNLSQGQDVCESRSWLDETMSEVVALFYDEDELHDVVQELQTVGFDRAEISVMPSRNVVERIIGHELRTVIEVADNPDVPRAVPIDRGSLLVAQGALVAGPLYVAGSGAVIHFAANGADLTTVTMAGIAGGALGAALGIFTTILMRRRRRRQIEYMLGHGGLVLWVNTLDKKREERARMTLARHPARDVTCHSIAV